MKKTSEAYDGARTGADAIEAGPATRG